MNIYDLLKKASPGAWRSGDDGLVAAGHGGEYVTIADYDVGTARVHEQKANKLLAVHTRNNFMELLAALKQVLKSDTCPFCGRMNSQFSACDSDDCPGVQLSAQMEDVIDE